jgi:hypothetical protein
MAKEIPIEVDGEVVGVAELSDDALVTEEEIENSNIIRGED